MSVSEEVMKTPEKETLAKSYNEKSEKTVISSEQRFQMIADAAYYRAEQQGFQGNDMQQDWLQAEIEIDNMLK